MTDDIVARLRNNCTCNLGSTPCGAEEQCRNTFEAADEIERLALHARLVEGERARKDELLRDAVSYLDKLEANMLQNGADMLLDE